ncbi:MAG: PilZ domain-containing protein [Desulfamplus sp.]|nr:PilZ domain-containing protein [Desulfamplus sp.]
MDKETVTGRKTTRKRKKGTDHARSESYAAINPSSYKLGQIVNISHGGLVFKYIDREDNRSSVQERSIFLGSYGYYLGDTQMEGDIPLLKEAPAITIEEVDFSQISLEHLMEIRKMRMEFAELTFRQIFALDKFIRETLRQKRLNSMQLTVESQ